MWCDYSKATKEQQATFQRVNPRLGPAWDRYKIWITAEGNASKRIGHWDWTAHFAKMVDANSANALRAALTGEGIRSKGDLQDFSVGSFHFAPESKQE